MTATPRECDTELTDHPVAALFPMMADDEYRALVADIRAHDQREPIWIIGDQILDGRNRYRACKELNIAPIVRVYDGNEDTGSLVQFVLSLNLHRRHLTSSQRAVLALGVEAMLADEAKERQRQAGGDRKSDAYRESVVEIFPQPIQDDEPEALPFDVSVERETSKARSQAAAIVGTNPRYVSDAKKIAAEAPDLLEQVRKAELSIPDAKRVLKEREREARRADNRALVEQVPALAVPTLSDTPRRYQTIIIDPPWDWGDEGDQDQFGRARPTYNTMTIDELMELPVGNLAEPNAHLYLWITNRSLPKGFALMEAWGFRYVTALTWGKPHFGMGNYFRGQTEHVLFGVRGSLGLLRRDVGTLLLAPRGERHSSKPSTFYELVETCSPGPWLEIFARETRPGWASWGAEVAA